MIYNVLPAVVQNRIPTLPSIRQSLSDIRIRTLHAKHIDAATDISPPATPPPGYTSRPGSARSHCSSVVSTDGESTLHDDVSERPESLMSTPPPFSVFESKTGINWKYANQGKSEKSLEEEQFANVSQESVSQRKPTKNLMLSLAGPTIPRPSSLDSYTSME